MPDQILYFAQSKTVRVSKNLSYLKRCASSEGILHVWLSQGRSHTASPGPKEQGRWWSCENFSIHIKFPEKNKRRGESGWKANENIN